jgi:hypothetical protein
MERHTYYVILQFLVLLGFIHFAVRHPDRNIEIRGHSSGCAPFVGGISLRKILRKTHTWIVFMSISWHWTRTGEPAVWIFRWFCVIRIHEFCIKLSHYKPGEALKVRVSQISRQSASEDDRVVSPTHRPPLPLSKYSWYSFLLDAELNQGPQCGRKISNDTIGNRTPYLLACSSVLQPTASPRPPHDFYI